MSVHPPDRVDELDRRVAELEYQVAAYHSACTGLAILVVVVTALLLWGLYAHQ